jgi:hypothetical protein
MVTDPCFARFSPHSDLHLGVRGHDSQRRDRLVDAVASEAADGGWPVIEVNTRTTSRCESALGQIEAEIHHRLMSKLTPSPFLVVVSSVTDLLDRTSPAVLGQIVRHGHKAGFHVLAGFDGTFSTGASIISEAIPTWMHLDPVRHIEASENLRSNEMVLARTSRFDVVEVSVP